MAAGAMSSTTKRLRILCLHGFTSNSSVHAFQLRRLITALEPEFEFLLPDGPHKVDKSMMDLFSLTDQTWHEFVLALSSESQDLGHRAWWYARDSAAPGKTKGDGEFVGLEETFQYLGEYLARKEAWGPIHAVWGFSQGACLAGILCALLQPSQVDHPLRKMLPLTQPPVQAGVIFAGFRARFEQYDDIYEPWGISVPILHVVGEKDPLVGSEGSEALMRICKKGEEVLRFEGGHEIPKKETDLERIVEFMRREVRVGAGVDGDAGRVTEGGAGERRPRACI